MENSFIEIFAAVMLANLLTVMFVYGMYVATKAEEANSTKLWPYAIAVFPLGMFAAAYFAI